MSDIAAKLNGLSAMSLHELRGEWRRHQGSDAPTAMSRELLQRTIGFKMQEEMFGGVSRRTLLRLKALRSDMQTGKAEGTKTARSSPALKPGTMLIREWQGKLHEVLALEDGQFAYQGKLYRSLTMIARQITGAHWSGPRFFGLRTGQRVRDD